MQKLHEIGANIMSCQMGAEERYSWNKICGKLTCKRFKVYPNTFVGRPWVNHCVRMCKWHRFLL